jgi:zinc transporter ZupT
MSKNERRHSKGYWMSIGISLGVAMGAALGMTLDNLGAGIGIGVAIGAGIGAALEQKNKDNIRPLTEQENRRRRWAVILGLLILLASVIATILIWFSRIK